MTSPGGPAPVGPYRPAVVAGDLLFVSGQLGLAGGALVDGGVPAQLRAAIDRLAAVLDEHGATLADVVKTTVFLTDMAEFAAMNEAYVAAFDEPRPARSAVGVVALPLGASVEIEAVARLRGTRP